jgi:hypothetical protein
MVNRSRLGAEEVFEFIDDGAATTGERAGDGGKGGEGLRTSRGLGALK